jgi:sugar phosphate isomerase/epimerase
MVGMSISSNKDIYFSFFMFTVDLRPDDRQYTQQIIHHMKELTNQGYSGFDLPIAPTNTQDRRREVEAYARLRDALDDAGLADVKITTNVGATRTFDPSSMYKEQRDLGLAFLKSRVDITKALRGDILAGPIILPYGVFPTTDANEPIWSDSLQDWLAPRYKNAMPVLEELALYAATQGVKLAIEPVDHWETPAPNLVGDVLNFLDHVKSRQVGVCIDSAHVVLGSEGLLEFNTQVQKASTTNRLHYVHISSPDRGALHDSWIPWSLFLTPILEGYDGPFLVEVFNAIPVFLTPLRLTRRKFWIPGEDAVEPGRPSAYEIAAKAIEAVQKQIDEVGSQLSVPI